MTAVAQARLVGSWALDERIGGGGQADVYRAHDVVSGAPAAAKVFHPSVWADRSFRVRFRRECEALTALEHPNIIPILDSGQHDGCGYLVMPLARAGNLAERIAAGPLPADEALGILSRVASALDAAHAAGLVHRDVTPGNILLDPSGTWLADFGIARRLDATILTGEGQLLGTAGYMAPEVLAGGRAGPGSDRYALAAVAFAALTGRPVFEADGLAGLLYAHAHRRPPRPSLLSPGLPRALDAAMERGLAKDPRDRPGSAAALVRSLERALDGSDSSRATRRMTRVQSLPRPRRRVVVPMLATLVGLAALGGGALAVSGALFDDGSRPPAVSAAPASAPLTVPLPGGGERAGVALVSGDLPDDSAGLEAVAADVGGVRIVAVRGAWDALRASRSSLRASNFTIDPLRVAGRTVGIVARPPFVADLTGLAPRWAMLVLVESTGSRALVIQGPRGEPERYVAGLVRDRGEVIASPS